MITWIVTGIVAGLVLVVVLVAIVRDPVSRRQPPTGPDDPLDDRSVADPPFPIRLQGYDPEHVDAWTAEAARALRILREEAGEDAVERARRRVSGEASGEELEDGGGDRPGVLDG